MGTILISDDWSFEKLKRPIYREFYFWDAVIQVVEEKEEFSMKENLPIALKNFGITVSSLSSFVRKIRNRMLLIDKRKDNTLGYDVVLNTESYNNVGPYCMKYGINLDWLNKPSNLEGITSLPIGLFVELRKLKLRHNFTLNDFSVWIKMLLSLNYCPDIGVLRRQMDTFYKKQLGLSRTSKKDQDAYLDSVYVPPKFKNVGSCTVKNEQKTKFVKSQIKNNQKNVIEELEKKLEKSRTERMNSNLKLYYLKHEHMKLQKKNHVCQNKLSILSVRNVNKRLKRKQNKIVNLQKENNGVNKQIQATKIRVDQIRKKYKVQSSLLRYHKSVNLKVNNVNKQIETIAMKENTMPTRACRESNQRIEFLENENVILQEQINQFQMSNELNKIVKTFHNGKYDDSVREVYASLLSLNVGVNNVEKVVRSVLEKLGGLKVERLPKRTFSEIMLVEAKALAQMQAAEAMLKSNCNTIHTDGTKRGGHEYGGLQIGTDSGQFSLGINEIVRGDAESFKGLIDSILTDMSKLLHVDSNDTYKETRSKLILSINNMMTDRHIVNQSLKSLLEKMKVECLPTNEDTTDDLIKKMSTINAFKCNLHVLVNFASQAESGLKLWEQNVLESDDCNNIFFNPNCCDFIRATTKLCVPGADEKSGYGLLFKSYLNQLETPVDLKLTTFHGHRINLLFSMGASVFYHRNDINNFIELYFNKEDRNRLVKAVYSYVNNPVYLAGCRALGIIDKILTGPLWRIIENVHHILDLNDIWLVFKTSIELLSKDPTELIEGKIFYPEFTHKDEVFISLFNETDEELNLLTIEALQIILINFLIIIERQLSDCLPGGIFNENTDGVNKDLRSESKTVSTTNIVSERDFANLDRLRREKPNANTIALEGIILFTNNKTLKWLDEMEAGKKAEVFKLAREKTPEIIKKFRIRKEEIKKSHMLLLKQRKEEKERKALKKQEEIKNLTLEVQKYGGLWSTLTDLNKNLKQIITNEEQLNAVKLQIKFHKKVIKTNPDDKTLLQFSSNNLQFTFEELVSHLNFLIKMNCNSKELDNEDEIGISHGETFTIKSPEERLVFMEKQRDIVKNKINQIKTKKNLKEIQEPVSKKPRTKNPINISESSGSTNSNNQCSNEDYMLPELHFQCGQYVAVAYSETWYPGQILNIENNYLEIKFLHPSKKTTNLFKWPEVSDIMKVENIFVFFSDVGVLPKDVGGRSWYITNFMEVQEEYRKYCAAYFN